MSYEFCQVDVRAHVLTVTINRPERRNALHREASFELHEVFDDFEQDPGLRVAVLTGAGDKAFCAGADLRAGREGEQEDRRSGDRRSIADATPPTGFGGLAGRFDRDKPVIAAVNGFALGGGFEIALACDLIIAADHAMFGLTEPRVGLLAGAGGIQRLIREVGPKRANGIILTGRRVPADEALRMGFVNEVVPADELLPAANRYAEEVLQCSPTALRAAKAVADASEGQTVRAAMESMWDLAKVQAVMRSPDSTEGPRAFAERRRPEWSPI